VNNAGILVSKVWDRETFDRTLAVNTKGPIAISQALLPHLAPDALIVMVSSGDTIAGSRPAPFVCHGFVLLPWWLPFLLQPLCSPEFGQF
jgi:NAD(P)-dependent dehydrogenase (short-subunit alcohol dehydrogenase family)